MISLPQSQECSLYRPETIFSETYVTKLIIMCINFICQGIFPFHFQLKLGQWISSIEKMEISGCAWDFKLGVFKMFLRFSWLEHYLMVSWHEKQSSFKLLELINRWSLSHHNSQTTQKIVIVICSILIREKFNNSKHKLCKELFWFTLPFCPIKHTKKCG